MSLIAGGVNPKSPVVNTVQILNQRGGLTVHQLTQLMSKNPQTAALQQIFHTSQPTIIATVTQGQTAPHMGTRVIATTATIQPTQIQQSLQSAAVSVAGAVPSSHMVSIPQGQSSLTASIVKPGSAGVVEAVTTVQIHPIASLTQTKLTGMAQNVVVTPVQHVTVASGGTSQPTHQSAVSQVVAAAPAQTLQASTLPQTPTQHSGPNVSIQSQRITTCTPTPLTVTVTPTPQMTVQPAQGTTVTYTATPVSQPLAASTQSGAGDQVTILRQPVSQQPTLQVQQTVSQPTTQTVHVQPPGQQGTSQTASPHTTPQGKATYSMRTRNQSKPQ